MSEPPPPLRTLSPLLPRRMLSKALPVASIFRTPVSVRFSILSGKVNVLDARTVSVPALAASVIVSHVIHDKRVICRGAHHTVLCAGFNPRTDIRREPHRTSPPSNRCALSNSPLQKNNCLTEFAYSNHRSPPSDRQTESVLKSMQRTCQAAPLRSAGHPCWVRWYSVYPQPSQTIAATEKISVIPASKHAIIPCAAIEHIVTRVRHICSYPNNLSFPHRPRACHHPIRPAHHHHPPRRLDCRCPHLHAERHCLARPASIIARPALDKIIPTQAVNYICPGKANR